MEMQFVDNYFYKVHMVEGNVTICSEDLSRPAIETCCHRAVGFMIKVEGVADSLHYLTAILSNWWGACTARGRFLQDPFKFYGN